MIRNLMIFLILLTVKSFARIFYRFEADWLEPPTDEDWRDLRLINVLHHTSLVEIFYFGILTNGALWKLASHGVAPVASVTLQRPFLGFAFRVMAKNVISLTRKRDHTWTELMEAIDEDSMLIIVPEGRLMRRDGLDKKGRPMTVRGGIADILAALPGGKILMIYSGGLHHVQIPGETRFPKLFKTIYCRCEMLDIEAYRRGLMGDPTARLAQPDDGEAHEQFKAAVVQDLERRRDRHCPPTGFPPQVGGPSGPRPSGSRPSGPRPSR